MIRFNICPYCGIEWTTESPNERRCPNCNRYYTIASYTEDGETFNEDVYAEILDRVKRGENYQVECTNCGAKARAYLKDVRCQCGELCRPEAEPALSPEDLKVLRKGLGYSQASMGALLGVSQGFYSLLESGRRNISDVPTVAKKLSFILAKPNVRGT